MQDKQKRNITNILMEVIKRDLLYIIVIIFCLGAMMYTTEHTGAYVDECNEQWEQQVREQCICGQTIQQMPAIDIAQVIGNAD